MGHDLDSWFTGLILMPIITYESDNQIGHILIDRPDRRNAINHEALGELSDALNLIAEDDIRVLVISGSSDQFCSGADLKELEDLEFTRLLRTVLDGLASLPFPTIAAISGACMGLGMQLAMSCDLRVATPESRFAVPVAKLGLMVDHWTVQRLALLAGHSTARLMLLTAEPITAARAHQVGLIHEFLEGPTDGELSDDGNEASSPGVVSLAAADALAARIAKLAPLALSGSKLGLNLLEQTPEIADPAGAYLAAFTKAWASEDLAEGQQAFKDRRAPEFKGR
ncbi:MAG TPA: enoyl-CoA hydratase-related protein [Microthrixaceae bacterium]|nr:enoyl-CoA hydratase-related protein [Microthrixaceae bacterium]